MGKAITVIYEAYYYYNAHCALFAVPIMIGIAVVPYPIALSTLHLSTWLLHFVNELQFLLLQRQYYYTFTLRSMYLRGILPIALYTNLLTNSGKLDGLVTRRSEEQIILTLCYPTHNTPSCSSAVY